MVKNNKLMLKALLALGVVSSVGLHASRPGQGGGSQGGIPADVAEQILDNPNLSCKAIEAVCNHVAGSTRACLPCNFSGDPDAAVSADAGGLEIGFVTTP